MDFLLSLFDIHPTPGTTLSFWLDTASPVGTLLLALLLGVPACILPLLTLRGLRRYQQGIIGFLRLLLVGVLVLLLLKPSLVLLSPITAREKLGVLVDASRSMSVSPEAGQPGRWDRAIEALSSGPLAKLKDKFDLEFYTLGGELTAVGGVDALKATRPVQEDTDFQEGFSGLVREGRDLSLGAVVVVSDGVDRGILRKRYREEGESGLKAALDGFNLPIHTFDISGETDFVDLAIDDLKYNEFAFLRQPFKVKVSIRCQNLAGTQTQVQLLGGGRVLGTRKVVVPPEGEPLAVEFEINPDRVGKFTYVIDSPVLPREAVPENNRRSFTLKVVRDKIRVLQVAGAPSWDVKFLRRLLKSDPNIDLVSFFILRGVGDTLTFRPEELSLIEFPYQDLFDRDKDLGTFDAVIFQNFAYKPFLREQSDRLLASLADYVRDGGGLAMFGGEQTFAAGDYAGTALEEVLPVKMDRSPSVMSTPIHPEPTAQALRHPVTVLHFDPEENRRQWKALPALDGFNPVSAYPDSVVLLKADASSDLPLLAVRKVGKGRTLAFTSDTSWYWGFKAAGEGQGNLAYLRFWKNSLRWLVGDPDEGQIQVDTERENYRLGEETVIQVKVMGADYAPVPGAPVTLEVRREEGNAQPIKLTGETGPEGELLQRFKAEVAGPYRVQVKVAAGTRVRGEAETVFTVSEQGPEMKELAGDRGFLRALSHASGGQLLNEDQGELRLKTRSENSLSQRRVEPLWDRYPPYFMLLGLLCVEWALRRRWGLR